jgi:hypothetical protein
MSNSENRIRELVDSFVNELSQVIRDTAVTDILTVLDGLAPEHRSRTVRPSATRRKVGRPRKTEAAPKEEVKPRPQKGRKVKSRPAARKPGEKRSPEEIARTTAKLLAHVEAHPGQRIEEIGKQLAVATRDLALPVQRLMAQKRISTKGKRRATKYFPR